MACRRPVLAGTDERGTAAIRRYSRTPTFGNSDYGRSCHPRSARGSKSARKGRVHGTHPGPISRPLTLGRVEPIEAVRRYGKAGPRLRAWEAHTLSFFRHGETTTPALLWLVGTVACAGVLVAVGLLFVQDAVLLASRGQVATAVVERVNEDSNTANIVFTTGPSGTRALLEPVAEGRTVGEAVEVVYDSTKPTRVRDGALPGWVLDDIMPLAFGTALLWLAGIEYRWWRWLSGRRGKPKHRR